MADNWLKKLVLLFAVLVMANNIVYAQYYLSGTSRNIIKWNQIKGKSYKIIYPRDVDSLAQQYLWLLENNKDAVNAGLQISPRMIPVILNPYTVNSNGSVVWTPKRMEMFTQPSLGGYPQLWQEQLVLHESRHVGQISQFTKHIYKPAYYFLGEQGTGLGIALHGARWYFEGDAVIAETALTNTGRGRTAKFMDYYRMSFLNNNFRSWDRWRYGSYKYYTPDIYSFGYMVLSTQRYNCPDPTLAGKTLDYISKVFYNPNNINSAFRKYSKYSYPDTYTNAINTMTDIWLDEDIERGDFTVAEEIANADSLCKYWNSYKMGIADKDGNYYSFKESYKKGYNLVKIDKEGKEKVVRIFPRSGHINDIRGSKIYFTQTVMDPRWSNVAYSNVYTVDVNNGKVKKLSRKKSYFLPTLGKSGKHINRMAVVENLHQGNNRIAILNADTGKETAIINPPEGSQISALSWGNDYLYTLLISDEGSSILRIDAEAAISGAKDSSLWQKVAGPQYSVISNMKNCGDTLYFVCDADGVSNIYMIDCSQNSLNDKEFDVKKSYNLQRLTNSRYSVDYPYVIGNNLYFSELCENGYKPRKINLQENNASKGRSYNVSIDENGSIVSDYRYVIAEELSRQENELLQDNGFKTYSLNDTTTAGFSRVMPKRYSKVGHMFNIHSWLPFYFNPDKVMGMSFNDIAEVISPGATVFSQNALGTMVMSLGYAYANRRNGAHLNLTYSGFHPIFEFNVDYNLHKRKVSSLADLSGTEEANPKGKLVESSILSYIPFTLNSNGWIRGLIPQVEWKFDNNIYYHYSVADRGNDGYTYRNQLLYSLRYYQVYQTSTSSIYPKWGIGFNLRGASSINGGNNFGSAAAGYVYGYTPGFAPTQGFRFAAGYQKQFLNGKLYMLSNLIPMPRGLKDDIYANQYGIVSVDYAFPVYLGDVSLGWFAYLQSLSVKPFADCAFGRRYYNAVRDWQTNYYSSFGADILLNAYFLHITVPVGIGFRYAHNNTDNQFFNINKNYFTLLLNVSIP